MPTTESAIIQGITYSHIDQYVNIKKSWSHQSCNAQIRSILNRIIQLETSYTYPCIGRHAPASPTEFRPEAEACAPKPGKPPQPPDFRPKKGASPRASGRTIAKRPRKRSSIRPSVFLFCGPPMRMNRRIPPRKSGETLPFFTPPQPHGDPRGAQKRCLNNKKVSKQQFENSLFDKDV